MYKYREYSTPGYPKNVTIRTAEAANFEVHNTTSVLVREFESPDPYLNSSITILCGPLPYGGDEVALRARNIQGL